MKRLLPLILLTLVLISACNTGKRALKQGNYYDAVMKAANRLRSSPTNKNARQSMKAAYPNLLRYNQDLANRMQNSSDPFKWERIADLYQQLNVVYDEILRSPGALQVIAMPENYRSQFETALTNAAEARYDLGQTELDKSLMLEDRNAAKMAYEHFKKAFELQPSFRNAEAKMYEAKDIATVHVVIEPIPVSQRYNLSNEFFQNKIMEYVRSSARSEFVRFYSPYDLEGNNRQPDHIIQMWFDDFQVGNSRIKETVTDRKADSVVVGSVDVVENGETVKKDVYGSVTAKVHIFEKELISRGLLDFKIIDAKDGAILTQNKFPGTHTWRETWGYFNGDERALNKEDKAKIKNRKEVPDPTPQDLFVAFTQPIYSQVTNFIQNYYRRY
jgi:tetratricopeptide (TPR) repeat protein